jgi:hypothetical protein
MKQIITFLFICALSLYYCTKPNPFPDGIDTTGNQDTTIDTTHHVQEPDSMKPWTVDTIEDNRPWIYDRGAVFIQGGNYHDTGRNLYGDTVYSYTNFDYNLFVDTTPVLFKMVPDSLRYMIWSDSQYILNDSMTIIRFKTIRYVMQFCNFRSRTMGLDSCFIFNGDTVNIDTSKEGYRFIQFNVGEWEYLNRMGRNYKFATPTGSLKDTIYFNSFIDRTNIANYPMFPFGFKCEYNWQDNGTSLYFDSFIDHLSFSIYTATGGNYSLDDSSRGFDLQMIRRIKTDPRDSTWFAQNKLIRDADTNGYGQPPSNWP